MGPWSTLERRRLLAHPHRGALLDLSRRQPGLSLGAATRQLGLEYKQARFHVTRLARAGLLECARSAGHVWLFPPGRIPGRQQRAFASLRQSPRRAALAAVASRPGLRLSQLAALLGRGRSTTHALLARLHRDGLVEADGRWGFRATANGHEALRLLERWA